MINCRGFGFCVCVFFNPVLRARSRRGPRAPVKLATGGGCRAQPASCGTPRRERTTNMTSEPSSNCNNKRDGSVPPSFKEVHFLGQTLGITYFPLQAFSRSSSSGGGGSRNRSTFPFLLVPNRLITCTKRRGYRFQTRSTGVALVQRVNQEHRVQSCFVVPR